MEEGLVGVSENGNWGDKFCIATEFLRSWLVSRGHARYPGRKTDGMQMIFYSLLLSILYN